MKKYIVLSVNENPEYLFYLPLTVWAWRYFGWEPILCYHGDVSKLIKTMENDISGLRCFTYPPIEGIRSETITQMSRLYAAQNVEECYLMTGDIDMIPLSDYWKFEEDEITVWGHDLTSYQHYPICYIGMSSDKWRQVMNLVPGENNLKRDLDSLPQAKSDDSVVRWVTDQDLITKRLDAFSCKKTRIDREMYPNGYPIGRVDRSAWTLNHETLIDCHMLRSIYSNETHKIMTMQLLAKVWPNENFDWFEEYIEKFKQLVK